MHKDNNYIFSQAKRSDIKEQLSVNSLPSEKTEKITTSANGPINPPLKKINTESKTKPVELKEEVKDIKIIKNPAPNKDIATSISFEEIGRAHV